MFAGFRPERPGVPHRKEPLDCLPERRPRADSPAPAPCGSRDRPRAGPPVTSRGPTRQPGPGGEAAPARGQARRSRAGDRPWPRPTIGLKLGLLTGSLVLVMLGSSGLLIGDARNTAAQYDALLGHEVRQGLLARQMQVEFKKQVQEWKDILLRGSNPQDMATYTGNLHKQQALTQSLWGQLTASDPDPGLRGQLID